MLCFTQFNFTQFSSDEKKERMPELPCSHCTQSRRKMPKKKKST